MATRRLRLASFTLIETMVALGLLTTLILQVATVQGRAYYFSEYGQNLTQAVWLAKRIMAQVEYYWYDKQLEDLDKVRVEGKQFEDAPKFSYNLKINEWKLPIANVMGGGGEEPNPMADMIKQQVAQIFGGHVLKMAHVEVYWGEGAVRESTELSLLLTNQHKIGETIATLSAAIDARSTPKKSKASKRSKKANKQKKEKR